MEYVYIRSYTNFISSRSCEDTVFICVLLELDFKSLIVMFLCWIVIRLSAVIGGPIQIVAGINC